MQKGVFDLVHDFLIFKKNLLNIDTELTKNCIYIVFTLKLVFVDIL